MIHHSTRSMPITTAAVLCLILALAPVAAARMQAALTPIPAPASAPETTTRFHADPWADFAAYAEAEHGELGARAAAFLATHRPKRDADIDPAILRDNLAYALKARETFPWAASLSEDMFFNDCLPYASLDETRESWRPDFYKRCSQIVAEATTATEAAQAINRELFHEINVHYNTGRKKPNQCISESIAQGRATCTGLSIILVNACRSVGIPARIAGVANWSDNRGNHTWVEIWDGGWHFTGADEYDKNGLNRGWFNGSASKAVPGSEEYAVWATSWQATNAHFPMVWDRQDKSVPAVDVTQRYLPKQADDADSPPTVFVRVWDTRGGERLQATVERLDCDGATIETVTTRYDRADLNDMPALTIDGDSPIGTRLRVIHNDTVRLASIPAGSSSTVDLFFNELGLTRSDAETLLAKRWAERNTTIATARAKEVEGMAFVHPDHPDHPLRIKERTFGDAPEGERSLWISMHGGGGAPATVNDQQWQNQIGLYEPAEGIYIAPRAPTNTWNLWHQGHIDPLFDRLIETYVATRGVDPNRVYLMGYSAGGDGVYQLAPRMADRFAAAAMMAGHPNETTPLGLRNLPFALLMGGDDAAYKRNAIAADWGEQLDALQTADPDGYPHQVIIYEGLGHWMQRRDAEILPWMASHTRTPWPHRLVWHQDDVTHSRFYWLGVDNPKARTTIEAIVSITDTEQHIEVRSDDVTKITLRLRDELINLDRPFTVTANGQTVFTGYATRTPSAIDASLLERHDHLTAATATLEIELPVQKEVTP